MVQLKRTPEGIVVAYCCPRCEPSLRHPVKNISHQIECQSCRHSHTVPGEREYAKLVEHQAKKKADPPPIEATSVGEATEVQDSVVKSSAESRKEIQRALLHEALNYADRPSGIDGWTCLLSIGGWLFIVFGGMLGLAGVRSAAFGVPTGIMLLVSAQVLHRQRLALHEQRVANSIAAAEYIDRKQREFDAKRIN